MTQDEAMKILNVTERSSRQELIDRFEHLFKVNDRSRGGSLYLQSKVLRAREALDLKFKDDVQMRQDKV